MSHARAESRPMSCLVLLVHMQEPQLWLWSITRAQPKSSHTQMGACVSQPHPSACNGNRLGSKTFACNPGVWNHHRQKTLTSYFACDPSVIAEPAPTFECLWVLEWDFQVCNPQLTNSAFIHYEPREWGHLSTQGSIGGFFFIIFKWSLSPSSGLQAAVLADSVQLLWAWH